MQPTCQVTSDYDSKGRSKGREKVPYASAILYPPVGAAGGLCSIEWG